jgi:hypothetical protein
MTFVSVAQATRRLGIDAKTLRRWLAEAQLPLHRHPSDGRQKGVSAEDLHLLAQRHQRSLAPLPQESPAPGADELPAWGAALQQQVTDLTRLLQQHRQEPAIPAAATQQAKSASRPSKPPRKPVHVLPRVEYGPEGRYVVTCPKHGVLPLEPDTPEWFAWLAQQSSFRFVGKVGRFTAHHEWRVPRGAWRAHQHIRNHSYTLRLAPTQELTLAVLEQAAAALQAHLR